MKENIRFSWFILFVGILTACTPIFSSAVAEVNPEEVSAPPAVQPTPTIIPTPLPSPFSLKNLADRSYGDGEFNVEYTWEQKVGFVRYKVNYSSDDLTIHGFVNIPAGEGPFPVVIALHGYIPANEYETLDYSTRLIISVDTLSM